MRVLAFPKAVNVKTGKSMLRKFENINAFMQIFEHVLFTHEG